VQRVHQRHQTLSTGPEVSAESLAVEVIANVGPGGNFLTHEHTLTYFKSQIHNTRLLNRQDFLQWEAAGSLSFDRRANLKVKDILTHHCTPELSPGVAEQVKAISAAR
jgi:trimethylamine---corrinoid protein Co-methyltransferase